ncbi:MAG TPA: hypothetical protein VHM72_07460, partial [Solirubrobacteraceae bacterium]|nr:hypothetical protein [Solirubrobacteraceae bacterium]
QAVLIDPTNLFDSYFDLDQETLAYVESWPLIVTRRSPVGSRPPANYKLVYTNEYYDGWARQSTPKVLAHLPLEGEVLGHTAWQGAAIPACATLASLVKGAPRGSEVVQATVPPSTGFLILTAKTRPFSWGFDSNPFDSVTAVGPGSVEQVVDVPANGDYQAWVQGSFSRPISVLVGGHKVGSVDGLDSRDQWEQAGTVRLSAGRHEIEIFRGGGRIYPGDGSTIDEVGYVMLKRVGPEVLHTVPLSRWRSLCGEVADWIELVRP